MYSPLKENFFSFISFNSLMISNEKLFFPIWRYFLAKIILMQITSFFVGRIKIFHTITFANYHRFYHPY